MSLFWLAAATPLLLQHPPRVSKLRRVDRFDSVGRVMRFSRAIKVDRVDKVNRLTMVLPRPE